MLFLLFQSFFSLCQWNWTWWKRRLKKKLPWIGCGWCHRLIHRDGSVHTSQLRAHILINLGMFDTVDRRRGTWEINDQFEMIWSFACLLLLLLSRLDVNINLCESYFIDAFDMFSTHISALAETIKSGKIHRLNRNVIIDGRRMLDNTATMSIIMNLELRMHKTFCKCEDLYRQPFQHTLDAGTHTVKNTWQKHTNWHRHLRKTANENADNQRSNELTKQLLQ